MTSTPNAGRKISRIALLTVRYRRLPRVKATEDDEHLAVEVVNDRKPTVLGSSLRTCVTPIKTPQHAFRGGAAHLIAELCAIHVGIEWDLDIRIATHTQKQDRTEKKLPCHRGHPHRGSSPRETCKPLVRAYYHMLSNRNTNSKDQQNENVC